MNIWFNRTIWYWFVLLLSLEMTIVYPAHLILDHAGIFHHHDGDEHEHDHDDDPAEDDICIFCKNLSSMEDSTGEWIPLPCDTNNLYVYVYHVTGYDKNRIFEARAPPSILSMDS